jgi:AcrR family transcriptional regulator
MNVDPPTRPRTTGSGGRARRTQRERRAETRRRLLDAAAGEFARDGYHGASLEGIADRAGYSKGALYYNFSGKEEIFLALLDERIAGHLQRMRRAFADEGDHREQLGALARETMSAIDDPEWRRLFFEALTHAARKADFADRLRPRLRELRDAVAATVAARAATGRAELPMSTRRIAQTMIALANGIAAEALVDELEAPGELYGEALANLFAGLLARSSAAGSPPARA